MPWSGCGSWTPAPPAATFPRCPSCRPRSRSPPGAASKKHSASDAAFAAFRYRKSTERGRKNGRSSPFSRARLVLFRCLLDQVHHFPLHRDHRLDDLIVRVEADSVDSLQNKSQSDPPWPRRRQTWGLFFEGIFLQAPLGRSVWSTAMTAELTLQCT